MPRIAPIDPRTADPKGLEQLDGVRAKLGRVPNLLATMAHSPAVLGTYLATGESLAHLACLRSRSLAVNELDEAGIRWWQASGTDPHSIS